MRELYDLTINQGAETVVKEVMEYFGVSKAKAKLLVANALIYCCVTEEIMGQIAFLLDRE